jgi:hypothetical protein
MYVALKPIYEKTGEVTYGPDGKPMPWFRVSWSELGRVRNLTEAKSKFGGSPVLAWIGAAH